MASLLLVILRQETGDFGRGHFCVLLGEVMIYFVVSAAAFVLSLSFVLLLCLLFSSVTFVVAVSAVLVVVKEIFRQYTAVSTCYRQYSFTLWKPSSLRMSLLYIIVTD